MVKSLVIDIINIFFIYSKKNKLLKVSKLKKKLKKISKRYKKKQLKNKNLKGGSIAEIDSEIDLVITQINLLTVRKADSKNILGVFNSLKLPLLNIHTLSYVNVSSTTYYFDIDNYEVTTSSMKCSIVKNRESLFTFIYPNMYNGAETLIINFFKKLIYTLIQ